MSMTSNPKKLRQVCAACVQCGACKAACPVHLATRREEHAPRGKLKLYQALLSGQLQVRAATLKPLWQCLLCGRCAQACPNNLEVTEALKCGRAWLHKRHPALSRAMGRVLLSPKLAPLLQSLGPGKKMLSRGLRLRFKNVKRLPAWRASQPNMAPLGAGRKVGLFLGCMATYARPGLAEKASDILLRLNCRITALGGCCGLAALSAGQQEPARRAALELQKNMAEQDLIITLCTSCAYALAQEYPKLTGQPSPTIMDINQILSQNPQLLAGQAAGKRVYLHYSCHMSPADGPALQKWLQAAGAQIEVIDACCGGGGLLPLNSLNLSMSIAPKLADPQRPLLTTCSGCYAQWLQLHKGQVLHPLEIIVPS